MRTAKGIALIVVVMFFYSSAWAADIGISNIKRSGQLKLVVGKSITLRLPGKPTRVTVGDENVANFQILPPRELHLVGLNVGVTNMTIKLPNKTVSYDIEVSFDISRLKQKLNQVLPMEKDIRVFATPKGITLSGTVSSTERLNEALTLAQAYTPGKTGVVNLLKVAGGHQVMLEVKIAEVSRNVMQKLGVDLIWSETGEFTFGILGARPGVATALSGVSFQIGQISGLLEVLKENGFIKILAEPNLVALSGQQAHFLAGGEFPVPVPSGQTIGGITINYKSFGVELTFTPYVLDDSRISLEVAPTVSEIDWSLGTTVAGVSVPALSKRQASTMVELGDGQTFAIAGLLREISREDISKVPGLGDLPILGTLFNSKAFQKEQTELLILVTPHLAKPILQDEQPLPTDYYFDPEDTEFFITGIFGKSTHVDYYETLEGKAQLDGEFGHMYPQ